MRKRNECNKKVSFSQVNGIHAQSIVLKNTTPSALSEIEKSLSESIERIKNEEDARATLKGINAANAFLREADAALEIIGRFARLEAEALLKIAELGYAKELIKGSSYRARAVRWLYELPKEEQQHHLDTCLKGQTIIQVWQTEYVKPDYEESMRVRFEYAIERIPEIFEEDGEVCLSDELDPYHLISGSSISEKEFYDRVDGLRNQLRKMGAVGVDDGRGTYISPEKKKKRLREAIDARVTSISRDLGLLCALIEELPEDKPYITYIKLSRWHPARDVSIPDLIGMFCAIRKVGKLHFSNTEEATRFFEYIVTSTAHELSTDFLCGAS
jgi:hypothetical protein